MNTKRFILSGLAGGITNWILGFLFYGIIFANVFPESEEMNMMLITLGSFAGGFFVAYIFNRWAKYTDFVQGAKGGAVLGLLLGIFYNSYYWAEKSEVDYTLFGLDVGISILLMAGIGGVVALVSGRIKD